MAWDERKHPRVPRGHGTHSGEWTETAKGAWQRLRALNAKHYYHGGTALKGTLIEGKTFEKYGGGTGRNKNYAATSVKMAREFGQSRAKDRSFWHPVRPVTYSVKVFGRQSSAMAQQKGLVKAGPNMTYHHSQSHGRVVESKRPMRATRLPTARGHAARPPGRRRS